MFEGNPSLIQDPRDSPWDETVPLILLHDGGGTIFSYYCLGSLDRPLYGISNPHWGTTDVWPGGMPEMARHYAGLIRSVIPRGAKVILGGWSLGGLTSLQVAHELARASERAKTRPRRPADSNAGESGGEEDDYGLDVMGIIMIDSPCPKVAPDLSANVVQHAIEWSERTREETRENVMRCFEQAFKMVSKWTLPRWGDDPAVEGQKKKDANSLGSGGAGAVDGAPQLVYDDVLEIPDGELPSGPPPPVILLRAVKPVPVPLVYGDEVARVDVHRKDGLLGWREYREDLVTQVVDIPGHHFNIFHTDEHLDAVTEKIRLACHEIVGMVAGDDGM